MRVLHLLTAIGHGGAETWLLNMLREMDRSECAMDFCIKLPEAGTLKHLATDQGATVHEVVLRPSHVGYIRGLEKLLRSGQYDIVHSHEAVYSGVGVWVASRCNIPVICTFHHWRTPPQTKLTRHPLVRPARAIYSYFSKRYAIENATYVTALSRKVMGHLVPNWRNDPRCRLLSLSTKIPPRVSEEERRTVREELGFGPADPMIIHIGRFIEQKNHHVLLDVFTQVLRELPDAKLILLGQGPLKDEILQRITREGLNESVKFVGLREDVFQLMSCSDLCLFPSRNEGFGLVPLEANAAGVAVVASRISGLDEAVEDGVTARLFDLDDISSMTRVTIDLLRDPFERHRLGEAGRARASREFTHKASAEKLRQIYRDAIALHARGR
ncbi:MAG: glycosyltransferase [Deltaproteobacteria bacterium]|nr:glycosyltransferase [Deltaproteobacteria bacterium]